MTTAKQKLSQTRKSHPKAPKSKPATAKQKLAMGRPKRSKGFGMMDDYL